MNSINTVERSSKIRSKNCAGFVSTEVIGDSVESSLTG